MANTTDLATNNYIFKNNQTYLSEGYWSEYFKNAIENGFMDFVCHYDNYGGVFKINIHGNRAIFNGLLVTIIEEEIDLVTQAENDYLVYLLYDNGEVKLCKATNINGNDSDGLTFLANVMQNMTIDLKNASDYISRAIYNNQVKTFILPIVYGLYGHDYWDLSRLINRRDGSTFIITREIEYLITSEPKCGTRVDNGYAQIYGGHRYNLTLNPSGSGDFYLFPVPVCNMETSVISIRNASQNAITLKVPLNYKDMYFEYVHDATWLEADNYLIFTIAAESDLVIKMLQTDQTKLLQNGVYYPKSMFEISQNVKNDDPGEGYTKAEANALFETQASASSALATKANTADLGTLAMKDSVDYETEVDNKPTYGSMAYVDDPDGITIDTAYARKEGEWTLVPTASYVSGIVEGKANSSSIADEYNVATDYEVGDLVIHEGQLYRYENNLEGLTVVEVPMSGSIYAQRYYNNGSNLYQALVNYENYQHGSTRDETVAYLLENGKIAVVPTQLLTPFAKYLVDDVVYSNSNPYYFYRLTAEYGRFAPAKMVELYYTKDEVDTAPTENSGNPVESGAIYDALKLKADLSNIADDYDPLATYTVGALVIKDGELNRYAYQKTQLVTTALTASGHADPGDYITYEAELYHVDSEVVWNEQTLELAHEFVLANENIFIPVEYEALNPKKVYEEGSIVISNGIYYSILPTLEWIVINIDEIQSITNEQITSIDSAIISINEDLNTKADLSDMETELAKKALITYVDFKDSQKADITDMNLKAPIESPSFTGTPTAPTPSAGDNSTKIATTAFVRQYFSSPQITYYVDFENGSDNNNGSTLQTAYKTLQKAIETTPFGIPTKINVVPYAASYFIEPIVISNRQIILATTNDGTFKITQDRNNVDPIFKITNKSIVTLQGNFFWGCNGNHAVEILNGSLLIYPYISLEYELKVRSYKDNNAYVTGIYLDSASSFVSEQSVIIERNSFGGNAIPYHLYHHGIEAYNGSSVYIKQVVINNYLYAIKCENSTAFINTLTGDVTFYSCGNNSQVSIGEKPINHLAELNSPSFTGTPTAPTPETNDVSTKIATTQFVNNFKNAIVDPLNTEVNLKAPLVSPAFTGTPTATTPETGDVSTKIATTQFVHTELNNYAPLNSPAFTGTPTSPMLESTAQDTRIANAVFVKTSIDGKINQLGLNTLDRVYAKKESPIFSGNPLSPTVPIDTRGDIIATADYVHNACEFYVGNAFTNTELTGHPTAPTLPLNIDDDSIATTAFVHDACDLYSTNTRINTELLGNPTAPTPPYADNSERLATTSFVKTTVSRELAELRERNLYVDSINGNDTTGNGTQSAPYKTLQRAIDRTGALFTEIIVNPGVYNESISIIGKNITIWGIQNTEIRITGGISLDYGAQLTLQGDFEIRGAINAISIKRSSKFIYEPRIETDELRILTMSMDSVTVGIEIKSGGVFSVKEISPRTYVRFNLASSDRVSMGLLMSDGQAFFDQIILGGSSQHYLGRINRSVLLCTYKDHSQTVQPVTEINNSLVVIGDHFYTNYQGQI